LISITARIGARGAGVACFMLALLANSIFDAGSKHLLTEYPAPFLNVMRYAVVSLIGLGLLIRQGSTPIWPAPSDKPLLLVRGLTLAAVGTCFMTALIWMPLSEATAIYFSSPCMVVALSPWLLRERVTPLQWLAVGIGLGGMLFIVRPGSDLPWLGTTLMIVSAVCYALFQLFTRKLAGRVHPATQYVSTALICLLATLPPALFFPPARWPDLRDWSMILGLATANGLSQMLVLVAFRHVAAATLAPLNYFHLLMAVLLSATIFHRPPDLPAMIGMAMIAAAGILILKGTGQTAAGNVQTPKTQTKLTT
jgi:drug/metabolite transporter (DMT)-like permease